MPARLHAVWRYRELLVGLVRKELKVKYKDSSLGFLWSMLNPAMYLVVFYVVFQVILGSGIPYFAVFLLSGLLAWNLFSGSLMARHRLDRGNGALVNKVCFPARSCRSPRWAPPSCTSSCRCSSCWPP